MAARRKRVQVGWWCEHPMRGVDDQPHPGNTKSRWVSKSAAMLNHRDPKKKPDCPRAVPMYILVEREES